MSNPSVQSSAAHKGGGLSRARMEFGGKVCVIEMGQYSHELDFSIYYITEEVPPEDLMDTIEREGLLPECFLVCETVSLPFAFYAEEEDESGSLVAVFFPLIAKA